MDHAIHLIKIAGTGARLSKTDIVDAFKIMPLHPSQWPMFGIKWEKKFYFSVRLSFGCRSSPHLFNLISEALCWILLNINRLPFVLHLLDDFLLIDFPSSRPSQALETLKSLFARLNIPLSAEKTQGPTTKLEFLGICLDSQRMCASLPPDKLTRVRSFIDLFLSSSSLTKSDLLSLLGHLNFAMRIIPQGRSFISHLLDLVAELPFPKSPLILDQGSRSDLTFWGLLLNHWNGISFFYDELPSPPRKILLVHRRRGFRRVRRFS